MSERQRLITKYTGNIPMHFKAMYQLHFLRNETEQAARHMLYENLDKLANDCPHSGINKILKNIYEGKTRNPSIKFGFRRTKKDGTYKELGDVRSTTEQLNIRANAELANLQLEDSYHHFKKSSLNERDKYYKQRAEIMFVLQNFGKAYELAEKSGLSELVFITALSSGNFKAARETIQELVFRVASSTTYVSQTELVQLLLMTSMATEPFIETIKLHKRLMDLQIPGDYEYLEKVIPMIESRNYSGIVSNAPDFLSLALQSIYTFAAAESLTQALLDNIVANAATPYAQIPISRIAEIVGLPEDRVVVALTRGIDTGTLDGRLDRVEMTYCAADIDNGPREVVDEAARLAAIRAKLEVGIWKFAHPIKK